MGRLVGVITQGLQNIQGIQVQTVQNVLSIVDPTIQAVQSVSAGDPQLSDIRAELYFQIGKVFQKKESHADAIMAANQSLDIRSALTHFDQFKSAPAIFNGSPAQLRWELSLSLEFVGDLFREERKDADARSRFDDTLAIRRELVVEQADDEDWAQGLSQIYTRLGDLDSFSNLAKALEDYQSSLSIARRYLPAQAQAVREVAQCSGSVRILDCRTRRRRPRSGRLELHISNLVEGPREFPLPAVVTKLTEKKIRRDRQRALIILQRLGQIGK